MTKNETGTWGLRVRIEDVGLSDVDSWTWTRGRGLADVGLGDVGLGDVGLGDVRLGDVELGDVGLETWDSGTWDSGTWTRGLRDVINKQHLIFALNL